MARRNQPAMEMGGSDTRPWSEAESDGDDVPWERISGLRRMWAFTRWSLLICVCGLGVALSFAISIGALVALLGL